jgi:hypothetical protein
MSSKAKVALHFIVNIGANILIMDMLPPEYKALGVLLFNVAQVGYAYFDPTYVFQKLGKKSY